MISIILWVRKDRPPELTHLACFVILALPLLPEKPPGAKPDPPNNGKLRINAQLNSKIQNYTLGFVPLFVMFCKAFFACSSGRWADDCSCCAAQLVRPAVDLRICSARFRPNHIPGSKYPYKQCNVSKLFHSNKPSNWLVICVVLKKYGNLEPRIWFGRNLAKQICRSTSGLTGTVKKTKQNITTEGSKHNLVLAYSYFELQ